MADVSRMGMGALLGLLDGREQGEADLLKNSIQKTIQGLSIDDNRLIVSFVDSPSIALFDGGQSCCESRYMTTDDDLEDFIGEVLEDIEISDGDGVGEDTEDSIGECHEIEFLRLKMAGGRTLTVSNHNEHNGWYGGFSIHAELASTADERYRGVYGGGE